MQIEALAPAKLNLTFDIRGLLPGGYHEVETLLQAVDLDDRLVFSIEPSSELTIKLRFLDETIESPSSFPLDGTNLIARAARLFFAKTAAQLEGGDRYYIDIAVEKNIPIGAGLAGGSSNAAATLMALNRLFNDPLSNAELHQLGRALGADVPFCLLGGSQIGRGRGDELTPVNNQLQFFFCIVKPRKLSVSTPWAYQKFDEHDGKKVSLSTDKAAAALVEGDLQAAIDNFGNVFEDCIFHEFPELADLKEKLLSLGCWRCHLSGSGPALYAIVADREMAHYVRRKVLKNEDEGFFYLSAAPKLGPLEFSIAQSIPYGIKLRNGTTNGGNLTKA